MTKHRKMTMIQFMFHSFYFILLGLALVGLTACAGSTPKDKAAAEKIAEESRPVEDLYNEAADLMDQKQYREAQKKFEDVERLYPYSSWATRAQMMAAYAAYQDLRYDDAIIALDRFMDLHPSHERMDYILYLKALCYYEQLVDVKRDQGMTSLALDALTALINRYPDSPYAREAKLKRDLTLDHLAGKEMEIGRYYLTRGEYNAAMNRFITVIRNYQTTTHTPEALHRLVESYVALGLMDQATRVAAVLGHNFPGSNWYQDSFALLDPATRGRLQDDRGVIDRTIESILKPN